MNSVYGYYNGDNIVPSSRVDFKKNQKVIIKPVRNLGKITDGNYEILLEALSNGEEVEYEYDHPFFSPGHVKKLTEIIEAINNGTAELTERELIEAEDGDE
ncbi:MAG: hypothetical protein FWH10_01755 [Oscillospiraceae bacterium]|nr:hypothetical protein [Oscillospiraceae bacterium]